jgi:NAD(P)-dependent dehydrogenase (short-subunit alcohol dehydrogenase family)
MANPVCLVVGLGPGLGAALARRFSAEGYAIAATARRWEELEAAAAGITNCSVYASDATSTDEVTATYAAVCRDLGAPEVLLYNAGSGVRGTYDQTSPDDFSRAFQTNALGLLHWAQAAAPAMAEAGRGVIGITGATASLRGKAQTTGFAAAKAAQRSLAQSLARDLGPKGVHVYYAIIDGGIDPSGNRAEELGKPEGFFLDADDIAETYWSLARQNRSAWTFEIDMRPHIENW